MEAKGTAAQAGNDWAFLASFLPEHWQHLAADTGALHELPKGCSPENLLRILLIHLACGRSLPETAMWARQARLADLSAVALHKRLRQSRVWLHALCVALLQERGIGLSSSEGLQVRAFDATEVHDPDEPGSLWRLQYSVLLPSLRCDFVQLAGITEAGTGASSKRLPIRSGDFILAGRGYSTVARIEHVVAEQAHITVGLNTGALRFTSESGQSFNLLASAESIQRNGDVGAWDVAIEANRAIKGRICVLRKTGEAIEQAHAGIRRAAQRKGKMPWDESLRFARYIIVFTTFPPKKFSPRDVLTWYRLRSQVAPAFKRFELLAQLGPLPESDDDSARAWLYGKLLAVLLTEKIIRYARTHSPGTMMPGHSHITGREFDFALNQVARAIEPRFTLADMFQQQPTTFNR